MVGLFLVSDGFFHTLNVAPCVPERENGRPFVKAVHTVDPYAFFIENHEYLFAPCQGKDRGGSGVCHDAVVAHMIRNPVVVFACGGEGVY